LILTWASEQEVLSSDFQFQRYVALYVSPNWQFVHSENGRRARFLLVESAALRYMDLCWFATIMSTEVFAAWFSLQLGVDCSAHPDLMLTHAYQLTCVPSERSCYYVILSLNLLSTISLDDCGWGAHQTVCCKTGTALSLHCNWTRSTAIHQSGYEAVYNMPALELTMNIYLLGHVREESSLKWLVICSTLNTLHRTISSAPWDSGDVLFLSLICASRASVTPCRASGISDRFAFCYEIILGKELSAPWDPGGHTPRAIGGAGLRASRLLRRGECYGPCGLTVHGLRLGGGYTLEAQGQSEASIDT
jgi:hypothetical protein